MQKKIKYFVIQGYFSGGYGWEDMSFYPMGARQVDYLKARAECMHDLREYRASGQGVYRVIQRYEKEED